MIAFKGLVYPWCKEIPPSHRPDHINAFIMKERINLENLKLYQNALDEFKKALEKDPYNKYLLYDLGLTYYYLGDIKQAKEWNQKALGIDRDLIIAL
jgi:tetratricopeptide (TPR) repeat protein